jgi:DNA polymerase III subunit alpha
MIAYALGITELDPIKHGLLFERFLNPERISMPDIDIDFDERRRADMIRYATEKYGEERVAQIVTYGSIKAKAAVKDSARVLGYPYSLGDRITKAMPPAVMGKDISLWCVRSWRLPLRRGRGLSQFVRVRSRGAPGHRHR